MQRYIPGTNFDSIIQPNFKLDTAKYLDAIFRSYCNRKTCLHCFFQSGVLFFASVFAALLRGNSYCNVCCNNGLLAADIKFFYTIVVYFLNHILKLQVGGVCVHSVQVNKA